MKLTRNSKKFIYEIGKCEETFAKLKERMVTAPVLSLWEDQEDFVVYSDTSLKGIRCVLMQHNKVIVYASRQPKPYEQKYPTHNLELEVIILALKDWKTLHVWRKV